MKIYSVVCVVVVCGFFAACSSNGENVDEVTNADGEPLTSAAATSPPTTFDVTDDPRATYDQYINEPENKDLFESEDPKDRYLAYVKTAEVAFSPPEIQIEYEPLDDYLHSTFKEDVQKNLADFVADKTVYAFLNGVSDTHNLGIYQIEPNEINGTYVEGELAMFTDCWASYGTEIVDGIIAEEGYGLIGLLVEMRFEDDKWRVVNQEVLLEYEERGIECDFSEYGLK